MSTLSKVFEKEGKITSDNLSNIKGYHLLKLKLQTMSVSVFKSKVQFLIKGDNKLCVRLPEKGKISKFWYEVIEGSYYGTWNLKLLTDHLRLGFKKDRKH